MAVTLIRKNHLIEGQVDGVRRWAIRGASDGDMELARFDSDGDFVDVPLAIDLTTGALTVVGDLAVGGEISSLYPDASGYRALANDVVPTIDRSDKVIELLNSTTGAKSILTDTSGANAVQLGQEVTIFLTAAAGNSYTLALSTGTLTFNAALETAKIVRTSLGWNVVSLNGATIV